ncbi:rCG43817, isoform CRA_c [Rattus norvegicus]|uniref:RCG43817, isoform CRA_c n=1 Tax=Rattus norvegicus TaxID=10116 RepID=A6KRX6_RAT|nr:rCG43817, isoform CRA_c [Rattus norvegicus]
MTRVVASRKLKSGMLTRCWASCSRSCGKKATQHTTYRMRPCHRTVGCSSTVWQGSAALSLSPWPTSCRSLTSHSTMPTTWSSGRSLTSHLTSTLWGNC